MKLKKIRGHFGGANESQRKTNLQGFFDGTFFSGAHLTPKQIIEFTYYWTHNTHSQEEFRHDMKLGPNTIVDWKMFCRDVTVSYFQLNPQKIGLFSNKY